MRDGFGRRIVTGRWVVRLPVLATLLLLFPRTVGATPGCSEIVVVRGGDADNFAAPSEPSGPSPIFESFGTNYWPQYVDRQFDDPGVDRALIHTFSGWSGPVCGATLELHLRAQSSLSNDSVRLGRTLDPAPAAAFRWWMTIHTVTGPWTIGKETILVLDLASLPPYGGFPTNILADLNGGSLDMLIEDDTIVDYAVLNVCQCGPTPITPSTWSLVKSRVVANVGMTYFLSH